MMESACTIEQLLENSFHQKAFNEKLEIIQSGRPCPEIPQLTADHKDKGQIYTRHFHVSQYNKVSWLTGSSKLCKLFCWPCLLFCKEQTLWNSSGYKNLNNLTNAVRKHETSQNHVSALLQMKFFGHSCIDLQQDEQKHTQIVYHNETLKKNQEILKRLIDTVCFLVIHELPFRCHSEENSPNRGNYVGTLNLLALYDSTLNLHLETTTTFCGTSNRIQNDLIKAVSQVVTSKIRTDIKNATFVALLLDETSDVMNLSQLSTTLRYVQRETGEVQERFISFIDVSTDRSASGLLNHIVQVVSDYELHKKIVAQTYDGAAVMAGHVGGLRIKVEALFPKALFVHCFNHKLNLVLSQSVSNILQCRRFFQRLSAIGSFFNNSSRHFHSLCEFSFKKMLKTAPMQWNFSSRLVHTVKENNVFFKQFFQSVVDSGDWDNETVTAAGGFIQFLSCFETCFLLSVFCKIFAHTDVLFNILQTKHLDVVYCVKKIKDTKAEIEKCRNDFESIWEECEVNFENEIESLCSKQTCWEENLRKINRKLHNEIYNNILMQLNERFNNFSKFEFISLIDSNKYDTYRVNFPSSAFEMLKKNYSGLFDFIRLRNELVVLYSCEELFGKNPHELVSMLKKHSLDEALPELYKLGELVLTVPSITASVESSFSALKRIKSYKKSALAQEQMLALAVLSIEKSVLHDLRNMPTFYDNVIFELKVPNEGLPNGIVNKMSEHKGHKECNNNPKDREKEKHPGKEGIEEPKLSEPEAEKVVDRALSARGKEYQLDIESISTKLDLIDDDSKLIIKEEFIEEPEQESEPRAEEDDDDDPLAFRKRIKVEEDEDAKLLVVKKKLKTDIKCKKSDDDEDETFKPAVKQKSQRLLQYSDSITHILTCDESDTEDILELDGEDHEFVREECRVLTNAPGSTPIQIITDPVYSPTIPDEGKAQQPVLSLNTKYRPIWKRVSDKISSSHGNLNFPRDFEYDSVLVSYADFVPTAYDTFSKVANFDNFISNIVMPQTILYSQQEDKVFTTSIEELKAFFGMNLVMGYHVLPSVTDYWSSQPDLRVDFIANIMPLKRYEEIKALLHFNDNSQMKAKTDPLHDRAFKVRPVLDHFNHSFLTALSPSKCQSIDEHIITFKGPKISCHNIKGKPVKRVFKLWCRCSSKTGYLYEFDLYTGKKGDNVEGGLGESVVLQLTKNIENLGCEIYFDNFFNSVALQKALFERNIYSVGTVKPNLENLPIRQVKEDEAMKRGEIECFESDGLYFMKWMDNKPVCVLSNFLSAYPSVEIKHKKGVEELDKVNCLKVIQYYNEHGGGVDIMDQKRVMCQYEHRSKIKYYLRVVFHLIDIAVNNSFIVYSKIIEKYPRCDRIETLKDYRRVIAKTLIGQFSCRKRNAATTPVMKKNDSLSALPIATYTHAHTMTKTGKRKRCKLCTKNKIQNRTNNMCKTCRVYLCFVNNRDCFGKYHGSC